jgi:hypothetical protein
MADKNGLLCAWEDAVTPDASAGTSDMAGSGQEMTAGKPGNIMESFEGAVAPKTGTSETGGKMKTMQYADTPDRGDPNVQLSEALNLTGKKKAGR